MPGRGNGRGRGGRGGGFKPSNRNDRESVLHRLGNVAVYPKNNDRTSKQKYKFVKPSIITSSIASVPAEPRIRTLSRRFLKSYYEIFDQPGRANLESQYSADAFFSFSATYPMPTFGRNLLEVREPENRVSLLVHDKTNIARALATFSPTEHMVNYLSSDVPFYIVNPMSVVSMQIIVSGVFRDTSETTNPLKAFTRVFVLKLVSIDKQSEPVYEIYNDLFMLQPPTPDQIKRYHHDAQIAKRLSNQVDRPNASTAADQSSRSQEDVLQSIMAKTRMNKVGSRQLLQDCNWDENKSMEVFNALFSANKIPQEFFTP